MNKILKDDNEHISYIVTDENSLSKDSTIDFIFFLRMVKLSYMMVLMKPLFQK